MRERLREKEWEKEREIKREGGSERECVWERERERGSVCVCVRERKRELYIVRHLQLRFGLSRNFSSYISSRLRAVNGHYHHFQSGPLEKIIF